MENEMAVVPQNFGLSMSRDPGAILAEASRACQALKQIISSKPEKEKVIMNGKQYLQCEDWQTIGTFYKCSARITKTEPFELGTAKGFKAWGDLVNTVTEQVISSAEAICMNDEEKWSTRTKYEWQDELDANGKKIWVAPTEAEKKAGKKGHYKGKKVEAGTVAVPMFQLLSMAQTRCISKLHRNVFAWIAVMGGYAPTPAEDITGDEGQEQPKADPIPGPQPKAANGTAPAPAVPAESKADTGNVVTFIPAVTSTKPDKNGKPRWAVKSPEGVWYSTYHEDSGTIAVSAKSLNKPVTIAYTQNGEFFNIEGAKLA